MIQKKLEKIEKKVVVEVFKDFGDPLKRGLWPKGKRMEIDLDTYIGGKIICIGGFPKLFLYAKDVKPVEGFVKKTIIETEFFEV